MKSIYRNTEAERIFTEVYDKTLGEWDVPYEILHVNTQFGITHVIAVGPRNAEPLVLLHGYGFSSTMWVDNIKALSERNRVYTVDFIGDINKSVATKQIETKMDCVTWFDEVLEELHIQNTNVMGLSYGGFLAFLFAIQLPDRINKLVAISPGASLLPQRKSFFLRCLFAGIFPTAKNLNRLMDYMCMKGNNVNEAVRNQFVDAMQNCIPRIKVFAGYLTDEELVKVQCPTLLLLGDHEVQYDPYIAVERAKKLISKLQAEVIGNAGHGLPMERPEIVNKHVTEFLV